MHLHLSLNCICHITASARELHLPLNCICHWTASVIEVHLSLNHICYWTTSAIKLHVIELHLSLNCICHKTASVIELHLSLNHICRWSASAQWVDMAVCPSLQDNVICKEADSGLILSRLGRLCKPGWTERKRLTFCLLLALRGRKLSIRLWSPVVPRVLHTEPADTKQCSQKHLDMYKFSCSSYSLNTQTYTHTH